MKQKKSVKTLPHSLTAALLCAVLLTALSLVFFGCSGSSGGKKSGEVQIKWLTTGDTAAKVIKSDDRIVEAINKKLGIKLSVQVVPENNTEKVNVIMASGDMPDIVTGAYGTSATQQWIDKGLVIPLNDYFAANLDMKHWDEDIYSWSAIGGKFYGVPFITQYEAANRLILMRQDWLDALHMSYPRTLDEMKTVLTAFTKNDPDGNGKNDTVGFTAARPDAVAGTTPFDWVFFAFGQKYADYALDANGNIIPWFEDASFIPGMQYICDLYKSGVVDNEIMLNQQPKAEEKLYQGRAGAALLPLFRHITRHENNLRQIHADASLTYALPPAGPNGDFGLSRQGKTGFFTCVTSSCKNPEKAAAFINFMISKEGTDLLRLGIEGIHYTKENGKIVFNEEERAKDSFSPNGWAHALAWGSFFWPLESSYLPATDPNAPRALETVALATKAQKPNLIKTIPPIEIEKSGVLNDIYIQAFSDMIQNRVSVEDGVKKLSEKWRSQGGDELLKALNDIYKNSK